ncbi:MAG: hypothetical protein AAF846_26925 [Chloroflexota bacterium]
MSQQTIIAAKTYGTQSKTYQGKRVSALKIGYIGIVAQVLLSILPNVVDISSKRDSYVYLYIPQKPKLRQGWLFIELSADKLSILETLTSRSKSDSGLVVWRDKQWMLPPNQSEASYRACIGAYTSPKGSPVGLWAIRADGTIGSPESTRDQLIAEYSKLDPNKAAWWWLAGNDATYAHRDTLKAIGCRWRYKRRAYTYIGDKLPESLLELLDNAEECRAIMAGMPAEQARQRYRDLADTKTDTVDVDAHDPCSLEEAQAILGVKLSEANHPTKVKEEPEKTLCVCEDDDGPKGWFPAKRVGTWVACGVCNPNGTNMPPANASDPDAEKPPAVRIIQACKLPEDASDDDSINTAIRHASTLATATSFKPTVPVIAQKTQPIPQDPVGELTGSVIANVFCYGYATHAGKLIYLNMGGPRSGVEAIRAKLSQGQIINLIPETGPSLELTSGEGNTGKYTAFINNLSEARFVSMILVHEDWIDPNYKGAATSYIMQVSEAQAKGQLLHHVRELVSVPVFAEWTDYLWQAGQTAMLIRECKTGGGITFKSLNLDATAWKRLITGGVANRIINIPSGIQT